MGEVAHACAKSSTTTSSKAPRRSNARCASAAPRAAHCRYQCCGWQPAPPNPLLLAPRSSPSGAPLRRSPPPSRAAATLTLSPVNTARARPPPVRHDQAPCSPGYDGRLRTMPFATSVQTRHARVVPLQVLPRAAEKVPPKVIQTTDVA